MRIVIYLSMHVEKYYIMKNRKAINIETICPYLQFDNIIEIMLEDVCMLEENISFKLL